MEPAVARHDTSVLASPTPARRRRIGRHGRWAAVAALLAVLAACGPAPSGGNRSYPDHVTIGLLTSSVGADAAIGNEVLQGAQLAVDVVNGAYPNLDVPLGPGTGLPHLGGAKLNLATDDIQSTATQTGNAATSLVQKENAVGLVMGATAGRAPAAAARSEELGIPLIDAYTTADPSQPSTLSTYFRLAPTDTSLAQTALVMLQHQVTAAKAHLVAIAVGVSATDAVLGSQLSKTAADMGLNVVLLQQVSDSTQSQQLLAKSIEDYSVGSVLALAYSADEATAIAAAVARAKTHPPLIGLGRGFASLSKPPAGLKTFIRAVSWSTEFAARQPLSYAVNSLYMRRYGKPLTEAAAYGFTATLTLAQAIDAAGVADPVQIRRSLRRIHLSATEVPIPSNGVQFGPDGQNELAAGLVEQGSSAGFKVVFPVELASAALTWPSN